jgi:hypothetical protein
MDQQPEAAEDQRRQRQYAKREYKAIGSACW